MKVPKISLEKAKDQKLFYVVISGIIYHPKKNKCLILKRSSREIVHPGKWGVVGGKMEWSDLENEDPSRWNGNVPDWLGMVEKSLMREAKEESGLETKDPRYLFSVAYIRPDKVPTVMLKFALKYKSGKIKFSTDFEDATWVSEKEVKKFNCIEGIVEEVRDTIRIYSQSSVSTI